MLKRYTLPELITACKENDMLAQAHLYSKYTSRLLGIAKRYSNTLEDAEDALICTMNIVLTKIKQYNGDYDNEQKFFAWMRRIAINQSLDTIRANKNALLKRDDNYCTAESDMDNAGWNTVSYLKPDSAFSGEHIVKMICRLPKNQQKVFTMFTDGYMHTEIAEKMGISASTSKSQYSRAKNKLQLQLT